MFCQLLRLFWKESGDQGETTPRQKEADLLSTKTGRMKSFWGRLGFGRKASSPNVISKQEKRLKELEELKFEIQKCNFERHALYQILDLYIYDDWDYSNTHCQLLREWIQLKNNIRILLNENRQLLVEQTKLPASYEKAKRFCEEASNYICVPRAKQQQIRGYRNKQKLILKNIGVTLSLPTQLPIGEQEESIEQIEFQQAEAQFCHRT
ncbi:uncharacterized protein LOC134481229 isoform X1 [Rattus norvegicus]|uniref:uncharacterized protein LOC134481229 isoform X1 n=1 Tax=Rattus norvegicus TaxID=10116 RepID=UPI002FD871CD